MACDLHRQHIDAVVEEAIASAKIDINDVKAIATTNRPGKNPQDNVAHAVNEIACLVGMPLSLDIGLMKGKKMAREHGLPFIPIHHMEAHALTVRMTEPVS